MAVRDKDPAPSRYVSSVMPFGLDSLNPDCNWKSLVCRNDGPIDRWYSWGMAPKHDWHLREWLSTIGKRQSDVVKDLDMNKAKASLLVACKQQYTRDDVNMLADYLGIFPHELLMHPADAMAMRRLKNDAIRIANSAQLGESSETPAVAKSNKVSTG